MQTVADFMTRDVVSVTPETPLLEAVNILQKYKFNGLPVVDSSRRVVGIITEYDLIIKGSSIHLPTFIKLFSELDIYKKDSSLIKEDLKKIFQLKVKDVMNSEPLTLPESSSLLEIVNTFTQHHKVNPVLIVGKDNILGGVVSRSDMLKFFGNNDKLTFSSNPSQEEIQGNVNEFLKNFEQNFVLVGRSRTRLWFLVSILFLLVGFAIAWFLILRIT
ncbi:CBS domain-containing protein [Candidatus Parcubacteria bacterium]|nr:CBS domain-containing protein [Candidatus Parcubacteria bacterium]